jgi:hypothetical protein
MLRTVVVLSYVFDRLLLLHGFEVGAAAVHAAHASHAGHTGKCHIDDRVREKIGRRCWVNVGRSGFLVATKHTRWVTFGEAREIKGRR